MDKKKLLDLLKRNTLSQMARQLLQEFPEQPVIAATRPVPIQNVQSIYRLRSTRNESLGEPIKGFPELVQGLHNFAGEAIVIYSIDSDTVSYKLFADASLEEFAGILQFPQSTLAKSVLAQSELQTA